MIRLPNGLKPHGNILALPGINIILKITGAGVEKSSGGHKYYFTMHKWHGTNIGRAGGGNEAAGVGI